MEFGDTTGHMVESAVSCIMKDEVVQHHFGEYG